MKLWNYRKRLIALAVLVSIALSTLNVDRAIAGDDGGSDPVNVPVILSNGRSMNWSGYVAQTNFLLPLPGSVSQVKGQWTVPAVACGAENTYSAAWVGIDGYLGATVEQIGTRQDCIDGAPSYRGFYELFPLPPVMLDLAIEPGDRVAAEVSYVGANQFELELRNLSTGRSFTTVETFIATRQSAEWVIERPMSKTATLLPLADFDTITFENASATIKGKTGTITNSAWKSKQLDMSSLLGTTLADATSTYSKGAAFKSVWRRSQ